MPSTLARLVVRDAAGNEREIELSHTPFTLGRQSSNDLVLLDNRISRQHARILQDSTGYTIEDAGSRHGTFINGEKVVSKVLKSGDQISLGVSDAYNLTFAMEDSALPTLLEQIGKAGGSRAPQLQHLSLLLQVAQVLHRAPALDQILTSVLDSTMQLTGAERGLLFLCGEDGDLKLRLARSREGLFLPLEQASYSQAVLDRVARLRQEEMSLEDSVAGRSPDETGVLPAKVRGVLALPLQKLQVSDGTSGETIRQTIPQLFGILYLDLSLQSASVSGLDREVLQTLAAEGATVIENARLFRQARDQERIQHEMSLARGIQEGLLPRALPRTPHFELHAITLPCRTVGGDYYDVIPLPGDRYGLTVADVSGKGLPAAMMAVMLQGAFDAVASGDPGLEDLFHRVNDFLAERTPPEMYATVFYGVFDPSGKLEFVNAAHPAPMIVHPGGEVSLLGSSNFPLGMFPGAKFSVQTAQLEPGDEVVIFSDGVTEAQNVSRDFFGEPRLKDCLQAVAGTSAPEVCSRVVEAVERFAGLAPQADDLTVALARFMPGEAS